MCKEETSARDPCSACLGEVDKHVIRAENVVRSRPQARTNRGGMT
jgi:hypothetical protein